MAKSDGVAPKKPRKRTSKSDISAGMRSLDASNAVNRAVRNEKRTRSSISSLPGPAQGAADERNRRVDSTMKRLGKDVAVYGAKKEDMERSILKNPNASMEDMARTISNDARDKYQNKWSMSGRQDYTTKKLVKESGKTHDRKAAAKKAWATRRKRQGLQ